MLTLVLMLSCEDFLPDVQPPTQQNARSVCPPSVCTPSASGSGRGLEASSRPTEDALAASLSVPERGIAI